MLSPVLSAAQGGSVPIEHARLQTRPRKIKLAVVAQRYYSPQYGAATRR
jgi:hypothetical protein